MERLNRTRRPESSGSIEVIVGWAGNVTRLGVTDIVVAGPLPDVLLPYTSQEYVVPFVSAVSTKGEALPETVAPLSQTAVNDVVGDVPVEPGVNANVALPSPGVVEVSTGAPGNVPAITTVKSSASLSATRCHMNIV